MDPVQPAVARALEGLRSTVYVGFSGGLDSTVLLHAAAEALPGRIVAVHVNHGLLPDARNWEQHCADVTDALGVGLVVRRVAIAAGGNLEARARAARYEFFAGLLDAAHKRLLLAHHRDDQAETVLLRMLQGRGSYGMPRERPLAAGRVLRPLLDVPRRELESYARARRLRWIEDPSNEDPRMDRNYLRHWVLPVLRGRWPDVDAALARSGAVEHQRAAALEALEGELLQAGALPVAKLLRRTPGERLELLRLWLARRGAPAPPRRALAEFLRQVTRAEPDRQPALPIGERALRCHAGCLHLVEPAPALDEAYPVPLPGPLELPHGVLHVHPDPQGFAPQGPVTARFRSGGESLALAGQRRSVKSLLREAGIPPWERPRLPLLFDSAGLLAIPGVAQRALDPADGALRYRAEWHRGALPPVEFL